MSHSLLRQYTKFQLHPRGETVHIVVDHVNKSVLKLNKVTIAR